EGFPGWHIECSAMATKYLGAQFDIHGGGMDLLFPHHESEIAQSTICNHVNPVRYWIHNNMITIAGKKMGKSYNNVIKLTEMFSGNHPLLTQAFSPMTIRFFILQTHYRSTLDFSSEALVAAEKGLKRLWESYQLLMKYKVTGMKFDAANLDKELDEKVNKLIGEFDEFINDDFNTAKVLANMFDLAPLINSIKDGHIRQDAISATTFSAWQFATQTYLENIMGLTDTRPPDDKLEGIINLLIEIRKESKNKKDFTTSDKIRKELQELGILLKDEKDGEMTWQIA
ncbi:MAG: DALR domain-containing protein, partial [Chitinophagaceae bacterium]